MSQFDYKKYLKNNPLLKEGHEFTDQEWDPKTRSLSSTVKSGCFASGAGSPMVTLSGIF